MENSENRAMPISRQTPLTFYIRTLLYMFVALFLRVLAFAPLAAIVVFPQGSALRWLALLCPVLVVLLILPLRFSFAQALVQPRRERYFSFDKALNLSRYGEKLSEGIVHALSVLKWGIPLVLVLGGVYYYYKTADAITLMKGVQGLGSAMTAIVYAVANFFRGIFGAEALVANGGLMEGIYSIVGIIALGALVLLYGAVRNSAYRYIWVLASDAEKNPRAETRRRLRGRRWKQLGVAMINLVLWLPMLFVLVSTFKGVVSELSAALMNAFITHKLSMPDLTAALTPLIFAFFVCYMPLLPVRRTLTAFYATKQIRHTPNRGVVVTEGVVAVPTTSSGAPEPGAIHVEPSEMIDGGVSTQG